MQRGCCFLRSTTTAGVALIVAMTLSVSAWAISEQAKSEQATTVPNNDIVCHVAHLNARFDDKEGLFEGASQSGTLLILRNISARACQVNAMPVISFEGAVGQQLASSWPSFAKYRVGCGRSRYSHPSLLRRELKSRCNCVGWPVTRSMGITV